MWSLEVMVVCMERGEYRVRGDRARRLKAIFVRHDANQAIKAWQIAATQVQRC
jgi:hypothetical protein